MVALLITSDIAKKCKFKMVTVYYRCCTVVERVELLITSEFAKCCEFKTVMVYYRCCTMMGRWWSCWSPQTLPSIVNLKLLQYITGPVLWWRVITSDIAKYCEFKTVTVYYRCCTVVGRSWSC